MLSVIYKESTLRVNMSLIYSQMTNRHCNANNRINNTGYENTWENNWETALFKYTYNKSLKLLLPFLVFKVCWAFLFYVSKRITFLVASNIYIETYELIRAWKDEKGSSHASSWCVINMPEYIFQYANLLEAITNI